MWGIAIADHTYNLQYMDIHLVVKSSWRNKPTETKAAHIPIVNRWQDKVIWIFAISLGSEASSSTTNFSTGCQMDVGSTDTFYTCSWDYGATFAYPWSMLTFCFHCCGSFNQKLGSCFAEAWEISYYCPHCLCDTPRYCLDSSSIRSS